MFILQAYLFPKLLILKIVYTDKLNITYHYTNIIWVSNLVFTEKKFIWEWINKIWDSVIWTGYTINLII